MDQKADDRRVRAGSPAPPEHLAGRAMEFSSKRAESLVRGGESGRFHKQVRNPTTASTGRSRGTGAGAERPGALDRAGWDPAGGLDSGGRDQEWTPRRRQIVPRWMVARGRRFRQGGW